LALTLILPIHVYSNNSIAKLGIPLIITGSYLVNKHIHDFYHTVDLQTKVIQIQLSGQPARIGNMKTISHYYSSTALIAAGTLYEFYVTSKIDRKKLIWKKSQSVKLQNNLR